MSFLVDIVALGTGFSHVLHFSPVCAIPKILHNHLPLHVALTRKAKVRSLRTFWKAMLCFGNRDGMNKEVLLLLLTFKGLRSSRERVYISIYVNYGQLRLKISGVRNLLFAHTVLG